METTERDKLIAYHDGLMKPEERIAFEEVLKRNPVLAEELAALRLAEMTLKNNLFSPSAGFTQKVMGAIQGNPATNIRRNFIMFLGVVVVTIVGAFMLKAGVFDSAVTTVALPEIDTSKVGVPSGVTQHLTQPINLDWKSFLSIFLFINLALAFIILDRTVLKPFFRNRQHSY